MLIYAADDEYISLKIIEKSVQQYSQDAEVLLFSKSQELYDKFLERPCDVAFLDINMPGMSGLELAKKLLDVNPRVNIIFATGYSQYALEAYSMFASGYILKPIDIDAVIQQLKNLRFPVEEKRKDIFAMTFGIFTLFVNGKPVYFHQTKSKELLAYLIDREGAVVTRQYLAGIIFEDEEYTRALQKHLSAIVRGLEEDLKEAGAEDIFVRNALGYSVDKSKFRCDLYDFLSGATDSYNDEYMEEYSWGEDFKGEHFKFGSI